MYQRVRLYIQHHHMLEQKETVIIGVSGGADSVCLLFMLIELRKELDIEIVAVHVNHGLRGAAADRDEAYVRWLCEEQKVELRVFHEDVKGYAARHKLSLEEAGRDVRRAAFQRTMEACGGTKTALAHHRGDNAETMLFHLCRGCGLRGLGGIAPVDGAYIRPLLCTDRREIESYLEKRGISYCTDETNLEDTYSRNRIRNHVIPYMEKHLNPQALSHMAETAERLREIGTYIEAETARCLESCFRDGCIDEGRYREVPDALRSYVVREALCAAAGRRKDIDSVHVEALMELMEKQTGRRITLPYGVTARRTYEGIAFESGGKPDVRKPVPGESDGEADVFAPGESPGETNVSASEEFVQMRVFPRTSDMTTFPEKIYTKWFDYDIIKNTVKIRHRISGDYITINQSGGTQKLKQYLVNEKVPQSERDSIWLAADGSHVMWIVGYRQNQAYQVTDRTKNILEIEFYGGQKDGREC